MFAGHFAAGLGIKAAVPRAPTWALLVGTGLLDVLFGPFLMAGLEHASLTPGHSPGFSLDFIDWSHSLAMAVVWASLYGALFWRSGRIVVAALAFAVFSHFLLDLALWPHSGVHVGFGLWQRLPSGWWWFELAFIAGACGYYVFQSRRVNTFGGRAGWACAVVLLLHILNSPWLSAMGKS